MNPPANPILVEVTRGDMVESYHRGAAVVVGKGGDIIAAYGDVTRPIYPRSAIKPLQAMVLAESGAIERFHLSLEQLALACASHSGQILHVDKVRHWLHQIGLDESILQCGTHDSYHRETRTAMIREGLSPNALYNNCSGKHAGMITVAVHNDEPVRNYIDRTHPVQQRVLKMLAELTNEPVEDRPAGLDGCGIPVVGISLKGIALAFTKIANDQFDSKTRKNAAQKIRAAMSRYPNLIAGENRLCTVVADSTAGRVLIKVGAEGVYAGMTVASNRIGFALKIDDGSRRAAEVALGWLITNHCNLSIDEQERLKSRFQPAVKTVARKAAGVIRPVYNGEI